MPKTKKNTTNDKLNQLSSKIENIRTGLDNSSKSCQSLESLIESTKKLKGDIAHVAQIFKDLEKEMLPILEAQDKEQQKDLQDKGLIGLNKKFIKEANEQEDETQKFGILEVDVHVLKEKVKSEINSLLNKMIYQVNRRDFECMKEKIQSCEIYNTFKPNVKKRIAAASNIELLLTIVDNQVKVRNTNKALREYHKIIEPLCNDVLDELKEINSIAEKCDKIVEINIHNCTFFLKGKEDIVSKKQSTTVNHPSVDAVNVGKSK